MCETTITGVTLQKRGKTVFGTSELSAYAIGLQVYFPLRCLPPVHSDRPSTESLFYAHEWGGKCQQI